jgi:hypothetical protein
MRAARDCRVHAPSARISLALHFCGEEDASRPFISLAPRSGERVGVRGRAWLCTAALLCWILPNVSAAQDKRPSEADMFGGGDAKPPAETKPADAKPDAPSKPATPSPSPPAAETPAAAADAPAASSRDDALLGSPDTGPQLSADVAQDNPLTIGGQLYLRTQSSALQHTYPDRWSLSSPNLLDTYFDARPNDRVRAFIRGRVSYDPTVAPTGATSSALGAGQTVGQTMTGSSGGALAGSSATGFSTFNAARGPNAVLDQMWIAFDIEHTVFVTAGKQHVKWGTGRFWTPTDYLHPVKRNPLDVFDARPGTTMLKLHVPWEARAWNFYAFALYEDPNIATSTLGQISGAGRAELVEGPAELGLDFLVKRDQKPRVGVDLSVGIGDFDLYTDVGLRAGSEILVVDRVATPTGATCADGQAYSPSTSPNYHVHPSSGIKPQAVGGLTWARKYNDNDVLTVGGEYFYNSVGYNDASIYPGLLFNDTCTPLLNFFYTGRHYASLFASLPAPYSWNYTTFTLSTIGNLSDLSFVSRLDYSVTLLTHLTFEAFAGVHYGHVGEFRLAFDIPSLQTCYQGLCTTPTASQHLNAPVVDLGVALRLKI